MLAVKVQPEHFRTRPRSSEPLSRACYWPWRRRGSESIRNIVGDLVRGELSGASEKETGVPRELAVQYVVGAYMAVLTWWLDRGAKLLPETVDAMFRRMATQGALPTRT
jgi:hypothetical protein